MDKNQTSTKIFIALVFLLIGIIAGGLLLSMRSQSSSEAPQTIPGNNNTQQDVLGWPDAKDTAPTAALPVSESGTQSGSLVAQEAIEPVSPETTETMSIQVPAEYDFDSGEVIFEPTTVEKTPAVLGAVLATLFENESRNGTYNGYVFESVSIQNGVAQVNLSGSHFPVGDMSMMYFRQFIEAAVFQYEVNTVIVYVNGNLFDFCVDDMSGGENGCPDLPRYWITERS